MDTFYFGRLNYTSDVTKKYDKNTFLKHLLTHGNKFRPNKKNNYQFGIFSVNVIQDNELGNIYVGELVKYQDIKEEPVVKEDKLSVEYIEDVILGKSRFFLLEKSHLIAYNPYGNIISIQGFCDAFVGVMIGADDSFKVDAEIFPINYEYEFMEFMNTMKTLNKLEITLMPSNPNNRDVWKEVDDKLNDMNVKRYKEEYEAKDNTSLEVDEKTKSKIIMAQDGYGKAKGEGTDPEGNQVTISTNKKESITKKSIQKDLPIQDQLDKIKNVFLGVIDKFRR